MNLIFIVFPIVFMMHELEEIIWMPDFYKRIYSSKKQLPKVVENTLKESNSKKFSFIVLEEFLLLGFATVLCYSYSQYNLYVAITVGYGIHIVGHVIQALFLRQYVPGLITGIISIVIMWILVKNVLFELDVSKIVIMFIPITIIIFLNLFLCHKYVKLI